MKFIVDFYDSKASYDRTKKANRRNGYFVEMEFMQKPSKAGVINLIITPDHFVNNPWFEKIPKYPYTVIEVKYEDGQNMVEIYYSGEGVFDYESLDKHGF